MGMLKMCVKNNRVKNIRVKMVALYRKNNVFIQKHKTYLKF